jgi:hypothetical protein
MTTVTMCVRVTEVRDPATPRTSRRMHVVTPASFGTVLVSATNPNPHRAAVFLYLAAHDGRIGAVELFERTDNPKLQQAGLGPIWSFTATLELPE